jgi:hypothetical protein
MKPRLTTTALLLAPLFLGCETKEKPLPEDVYEKGWDETTRSQRVGLLRQDLNEHIQLLDSLEPGTERHREAMHDASLTLSALRPELTTTERGKDEYRELETRVEALTGDAK